MSKLCVILDTFVPLGMTSEEALKIRGKIRIFSKEINTANGATTWTIFCPGQGILGGLRIQLSQVYQLYHAELGLTDPESDMSISAYSYAEQLAMLSEGKTLAEHCYPCGYPVPIVASYHPQGVINSDTVAALTALGINNTTVGDLHPVIPNAFSIPDMNAKIDAMEDCVVLLSTADLPAEWESGSYSTFGLTNNMGLKAAVIRAKTAGYEIVPMCGF